MSAVYPGYGFTIGSGDSGGSGSSPDNSVKRETLLIGNSVAVSQNPSGLNAPLQVEFGPDQGTINDPVQISSNGSITINTTGTYFFRITLQSGRTGASGVSYVYGRLLINGVQAGNSILAELDNPNIVVPLQFDSAFELTTGSVVTVQIYRDSIGANSGGLIAGDPSLGGWADSPSASILIGRNVPVYQTATAIKPPSLVQTAITYPVTPVTIAVTGTGDPILNPSIHASNFVPINNAFEQEDLIGDGFTVLPDGAIRLERDMSGMLTSYMAVTHSSNNATIGTAVQITRQGTPILSTRAVYARAPNAGNVGGGSGSSAAILLAGDEIRLAIASDTTGNITVHTSSIVVIETLSSQMNGYAPRGYLMADVVNNTLPTDIPSAGAYQTVEVGSYDTKYSRNFVTSGNNIEYIGGGRYIGTVRVTAVLTNNSVTNTNVFGSRLFLNGSQAGGIYVRTPPLAPSGQFTVTFDTTVDMVKGDVLTVRANIPNGLGTPESTVLVATNVSVSISDFT